jgi:hypothetical protein
VDRRVALIKTFARGLPTDRVKLEVSAYGFDFLSQLRIRGIQLEYGELTLSKVLHKYKLTNLTESQLDELLEWHVAKLCNVCLYFDRRANSVFSFNLDNNYAQGGSHLIPEVQIAVRTLVERLNEVNCKPLVVASGRGYHVWCRLATAVPNERLYPFMVHAAAGSLLVLQQRGLDTNNMKFNLYPDIRIQDLVSLRLFGSKHAKNHVFSCILDGEVLLDEEASWAYFEDYVENRAVPLDTFNSAYDTLVKFPP